VKHQGCVGSETGLMFVHQLVLDFQQYQEFLLPEVQNLLAETWPTGSLIFVIIAIGGKPGHICKPVLVVKQA
jgi:hypothetical protein